MDDLGELIHKVAKLEQRDEFNDRWMENFTKMIDKIDRNIEKLTIAVQQIAVQQEQINTLRKGHQDDREMIEKLFSGQKKIAEDITDLKIKPGLSAEEDSRKLKIGTLQTVINIIISAGISGIIAAVVIARSLPGGQ